MKYWLMKSEPTCYSIDDLANEANQTTHWDGVRNYQARNMMRDDIKIGDQVLYYHSNCKEPGVVGTMTVIKEAYPDHTAFDPDDEHYDPKSSPDNPRWVMVDVKFSQKFNGTVSLTQMRANPLLESMVVLRKGNRLSITPVTSAEWETLLAMS